MKYSCISGKGVETSGKGISSRGKGERKTQTQGTSLETRGKEPGLQGEHQELPGKKQGGRQHRLSACLARSIFPSFSCPVYFIVFFTVIVLSLPCSGATAVSIET